MEPAKLDALLDVSACWEPQPDAIFTRVLHAVNSVYGDTMAMINLIEGDRIRYRAMTNPHPLFERVDSIHLRHSYCQFATGFATGAVQPILIQDAACDPALSEHPAVRLGLTRYLGVPISDPEGSAVGTLCFLDGRSQEPLTQEDVEFLTLLAMRVSAEVERERSIQARLEQEREASARLQRAAEEKRRFTALVIHDLRQPISTLRTMAHLLRGEEDPDEREDCLGLVDQCVGSMSEMVDELLEYAEIEAGEIRWRPEDLELNRLVRECADPFIREAETRGVRLEIRLEDDLGGTRNDRAKLSHMVRNLISNAVKYTAVAVADEPGRAGLVRVEAVSAAPEGWRLVVRDNGPGMEPVVAERIFDEFYQGPDTAVGESRSGYPRGRGLGLASVRHLCAAMGASVEVETTPGAGSCFTLTFPRRPDL